jgi:hypothetical protein
MGDVKVSTRVNEPRVMSRVALDERGRRAVMAMLATADVRRIWHYTAHSSTERIRRTHRRAEAELQQRGMLPRMPQAGSRQVV